MVPGSPELQAAPGDPHWSVSQREFSRQSPLSAREPQNSHPTIPCVTKKAAEQDKKSDSSGPFGSLHQVKGTMKSFKESTNNTAKARAELFMKAYRKEDRVCKEERRGSVGKTVVK